jgi:hypothetical protein
MAKAIQDIVVKIKVDGSGQALVQIDKLGGGFMRAQKAAEALQEAIKRQDPVLKGSVADYRRQISALKQLRDNTAKTADDFQRQTLAIEKLQVKMRDVTSATSSYNKVNEKQISNAGLAGATLTEFGRTISDLPYGIRGVANNLSQLSTLFITLMSKTKGFTNTLRLLKAELMGPLGFILVFQAVISLLDFFAGKTDKAKKSTDEFTKSVSEELTVLRQLNAALENNSIAREASIEIIKDALKSSKELKKILDDTTLSEQQSTEAIIKLSKERQKLLELEQEISKAKNELAKNEADTKTVLNDITAKANELNKIDINNTVLRTITQDQLNALGLKRNELEQSHIDLLLRLRDLIVELNGLDSETIKNKEKELQVGTIAYYQDLIKELRTVQNESTTTRQGYKDIQREIDFFQAKIDAITGSTKKLTKANKEQKESFEELIGISGSFYGEFYRSSQELNDNIAQLSRQRRNIELKDIKLTLTEDIAALKQRSLTREGFERGKQKLIEEALRAEIKSIEFALQYDKLTINERIKLRERLAKLTEQVTQIQSDKILEAAKEVMAGLEFMAGALDANLEAEISREERRTVLRNNELKKRLRDESLSAKERESINNQIAANEESLQAKRDKLAEKQFKIQKAISIGQALISTYEMATKAYGALVGIPVVGPALAKIAAGVATAFGLAQVRAIARTKFVPSGISGGGGGAGGGAGIEAPDFNVVGASQTSQLAETVLGQQAKPVKAFVVGKDITTQQELDRNITNTASFG